MAMTMTDLQSSDICFRHSSSSIIVRHTVPVYLMLCLMDRGSSTIFTAMRIASSREKMAPIDPLDSIVHSRRSARQSAAKTFIFRRSRPLSPHFVLSHHVALLSAFCSLPSVSPQWTPLCRRLPGRSNMVNLCCFVTITIFVTLFGQIATGFAVVRATRATNKATSLNNIYDDWRSDAVVDTMFLDEDNVRQCLEEFIESDYGKQMFGRHERPASIGVTGTIDLVEVSGPEVTLTLDGKFWHRRDTVLGRAAMWLNARMPEITDVLVADQEELNDFDEVLDDFGEVLFKKDKRAPDYSTSRHPTIFINRPSSISQPKSCHFFF